MRGVFKGPRLWHGAADNIWPVQDLPAEDGDLQDEALPDRTLDAPARDPGPPATVGADGTITAPSGLTVTLQDVIWNAPGPVGLTSRFRFIAPAIAGAVDFDATSADMLWLCQTFALPRIAQPGPMPAQIVISLSDIPVPFGEANPEATQFFEAYSVVDGQCLWEVF